MADTTLGNDRRSNEEAMLNTARPAVLPEMSHVIQPQANTPPILRSTTGAREITAQQDMQLWDQYRTREEPWGSQMPGDGQIDHPVAKSSQVRNINVLLNAVKKRNWDEVCEFLKRNPGAIQQPIASDSSTILHSVIYHKKGELVDEIVNLLKDDTAALKNKTSDTGFTALHSAARYGDTEAAKVMVNKLPKLTLIRDKKGMIPLEVALHHATIGQKDIVEFLYSETKYIQPSPFEGRNGARLLCSAIEANFYDMALSIVQDFPNLVMMISPVHEMCGLELLVQRPFAFRSGANKMRWWRKFIYSLIQVDMTSAYVDYTCLCATCTKRDEENTIESSECTKEKESLLSKNLTTYLILVPRIRRLCDQKLMHKQATALLKHMLLVVNKRTHKLQLLNFFNKNPNIIKAAIKHGITEFVEDCLKRFNYLTEYSIPDQSMIEMAIVERNEMMVSIICDHGDNYGDKIEMVSTTDNENNTILHFAAKIAPYAQLNLVSGVALQMQRELQWLKGVESIISVNDRYKRNKNGETAESIFTEDHKELMKKGEDWMKDTSGSCMIVAALIATVAFAAAFTVPGGNVSDGADNPKNGNPVFLGKSSFSVFVAADALALFSSITSVLMFLAIYTSRYAEKDFLRSLPQKLIIGLATLFISMAAILVAFCASLFIVVGNGFAQAIIPISLFGCCPLALFVFLQLPLFLEMVRTTYWRTLFKKHRYVDPSIAAKNKKTKRRYKEPCK